MALAVLDLNKAIEFSNADFAAGQVTDEENSIIREANVRRRNIWSEQGQFADDCDRWDALYYPSPEHRTAGGMSHWAGHSSAKLPGRAHVSVNTPPIYVDIPAALQAVPPVENIVPAEQNDQSRMLASMVERLYTAWKGEHDFDLVGHKACVIKGLYGRTAGKVWWDEERGFPCIDVIDQPRNLWLGWGQSDYRTLDWAAYTYTMTPESIYANYGLVTSTRADNSGETYPYLIHGDMFTTWRQAREAMWYAGGEIEVTDYWYLQPADEQPPERARMGKVKHDTWNAIIVGNRVVQNRKFPEYDGKMPFVPIFNTFIPGVPNGRPELFDIEQLIREKDQQITNGSQLMYNVVNAQYWQLVGPDADAVPAGLRPKANQVIAPGGGNRIEGIQPWMPSFQLEEFLGRIDREMVDVSGLNDLLRGMAPPSVMSSGKAINALIANYETRISMKRTLYYQWRGNMWDLATTLWKAKQPELTSLFEAARRVDAQVPSLTPRDDMEAAQIARTLVDGKLWAAVRGMDRTGVDDPEAEQNVIREEQTDVTLNPASVQVIAAVAQQLQALGFANAQQAVEGMNSGAPPDQGAMMNDMRSALGGGAGAGVMGSGEGPIPAQEAMPGNTPEGAAVGAGEPLPPGSPGEAESMAQTQIKGGEASSRLLFQQPLPAGGPGEAPPEEEA